MEGLLATALFYVFGGLVLASGLAVISSRNPVHSVLFLIFAFFNAAGLFVLIGAEYIAMTLVIVYVGAVAVLFLFVVMMLDINFAELRQGFLRYLPLGAAVALLILAELLAVVWLSLVEGPALAPQTIAIPDASEITNTRAIGQVLYTDYIYPFQVSGLILLVAMIGAIVLTLRQREGVRRQSIYKQIGRKRKDTVEVVKIAPGEGVD